MSMVTAAILAGCGGVNTGDAGREQGSENRRTENRGQKTAGIVKSPGGETAKPMGPLTRAVRQKLVVGTIAKAMGPAQYALDKGYCG